MCRLIAVAIRRGDLYETIHGRVWLYNPAQKSILLWFQAAGFLEHDRYATHVDFKSLNVWCREPASSTPIVAEELSQLQRVYPELGWSLLVHMSCSTNRGAHAGFSFRALAHEN